MMYSVEGEHFLELLNEDEANDLLCTLQARADTNPAETPTLARQIADVTDWLGYLAGESSEARADDAAAEHAAGIYADHLAGIA